MSRTQSDRGPVKRRLWLLGASAAVLSALLIIAFFGFLGAPQPSPLPPADRADQAVSPPQAQARRPEADVADDFLQEVIEDAVEGAAREAARDLEARQKVPPHPRHVERVENTANETLEETALKLAYSDDYIPANMSIRAYTVVNPPWYTLVATRLVRVRKLLEVGGADPSKITPLLRKLLLEASQENQAALDELVERFKREGHRTHDPDPPDKWEDCRYRAIGATYVLAELKDYDALPVLARCYRIQDRPDDPYQRPARRIPIPLSMVLYAMHRLIVSFPEQALAPDARRLREEYLEAAKVLPEPEMITVTSWTAQYAETDPRIMLTDPEGRVLKGQPTMQIAVWPSCFTDGSRIMDRLLYISDRGQDLFEKAESFVTAAFPNAMEPESQR